MEWLLPSAMYSFEEVLQPSPIGDSMLETLSAPCRIDAHVMRRSFLYHPTAVPLTFKAAASD
jgi:hypothetical protein